MHTKSRNFDERSEGILKQGNGMKKDEEENITDYV